MKKRLLSLSLAAAMVLSMAGCRGAEPAATTAAPAAETTTAAAADTTAAEGDSAETEAAEPAGNFKIGIITGTALPLRRRPLSPIRWPWLLTRM